MNTSIRAISLTLRELVAAHLKTDVNLRVFFDSSGGGTMLVSLLAPEELAANNEGVSLWLYRIERDEQTLNLPPRRSARDRLLHEPLPLKLHYLVVPVVDVKQRPDGPELEQNIVGAVMQVLHDHPLLRGTDLKGDLAGSSEEIHVRLESLDLDQVSRMWEALEHRQQADRRSQHQHRRGRWHHRARPSQCAHPGDQLRRFLPQLRRLPVDPLLLRGDSDMVPIAQALHRCVHRVRSAPGQHRASVRCPANILRSRCLGSNSNATSGDSPSGVSGIEDRVLNH